MTEQEDKTIESKEAKLIPQVMALQAAMQQLITASNLPIFVVQGILVGINHQLNRIAEQVDIQSIQGKEVDKNDVQPTAS